MHTKKHLGFSGLRKIISERVLQIDDIRQEAKVDHVLHDCCLSAFAMMFFQDPSMLEFQTRLQQKIDRNNLETLFNVSSIPKATQLRDVIDEVPPTEFEKIFPDFFRQLQRGKQLEQYQFLDGMYLVPLDGTQYFSSENISCPNCLNKTKKNGKIIYYHQALGAAIVHPGLKQIIPLAPEPIRNIDGSSKQDCEINAGKRILKKLRTTHPKLKIIITGDDLFSKQPFIDELKDKNMSFILVAKPSDHKVLYQCFLELRQMGKTSCLEYTDQKGRQHLYEWVNGTPLNGTKDADDINYFEYSVLADEKTQFHCSWVTDITINKDNIKKLVKGGRARWKIENENFNTLKNQGYHAEHNFGHGKKNLSYNFFLLIVLAFFMHQIFELTDHLYRKCRNTFSASKEYWNQLRCTIRIKVFRTWESLLEFILDPPEEAMPP